jgi:hypothetical protein
MRFFEPIITGVDIVIFLVLRKQASLYRIKIQNI